MAAEVVPALLVHSAAQLQDGLERLRGTAPWVQVDLVGKNYLHGQESFPCWEEFNFEADMMLPDPAAEVEAVVALGAARVVVHAGEDAREALELLQKYREGDFSVGVGVALHPDDSLDILKQFEGLYDFVQVMGIAHEGKQGEQGDERAIALVRELRATHPALLIQVDGAVAPRVKEFVEAGASRLVIGSAIVHADDPKSAYKDLLSRAN
jgi:pentose-5-phosphate-3-epimerase